MHILRGVWGLGYCVEIYKRIILPGKASTTAKTLPKDLAADQI